MKPAAIFRVVLMCTICSNILMACSSQTRLENDVISQIIEQGPTDLVKGRTGFAQNGEISIWYEVRMPESTPRGTVVLVMGVGQTSMLWPQYFLDSLTSEGYRVIRFDNRETGLTTWTDNANRLKPYSLADMGDDAIAILDKEGIDSAHVIGISMGGVIAQQIAVRHPARVSSFTSMMSMPVLALPPTGLLLKMMWPTLLYGWQKSERSQIKYDIAVHSIIKGKADYPVPVERHANRVLYEMRYRNGRNPDAVTNQGAALEQEALNPIDLTQINSPTLIIHGKQDPVIPFDVGGPALANLIPHARTLWIENMGHSFSESNNVLIIEALINLFESVSE
ncbi:MAG: alpha/beta hydrolase [Pseudomonadales bacterium]|nr:alpha/beta hydrolase [Pseudomonadales bacterium]